MRSFANSWNVALAKLGLKRVGQGGHSSNSKQISAAASNGGIGKPAIADVLFRIVH